MNRSVGIHDPSHGLSRRAEVWSWDITVDANYMVNAHRVATSESIKFSSRKLAGVYRNSAFGTTERHIGKRSLPCHQHAQRTGMGKISVRVVADSAFVRTT